MRTNIDKSKGYVIIWRSIMDTSLWSNPKLERIYHWVMYRANFESREVFPTTEKIQLKPGQFITSFPHAAAELKISVGSVKTYLDILKAESIIESYSTNKYTVITVKNWKELQNPERGIETKTKTERKQTETDNTVNTLNTSSLPENDADAIEYILSYKKEKASFLNGKLFVHGKVVNNPAAYAAKIKENLPPKRKDVLDEIPSLN